MKYIGQESDITSSSDKIGVLLVNLGTPDRPVCPGFRITKIVSRIVGQRHYH